MSLKFLDKIRFRLVKEFLDLVILNRLNNVPSSGYDILHYICRSSGFFISPGSIYAVLYFLEREGLVKAKLINSKRLYFITPQGKDVVQKYFDNQDKIVRYVTDFFRDLASSSEASKYSALLSHDSS